MPLLDTAAELTDRALFADGEHFNQAGNVARAQLLYAFFAGSIR